MKKIIIAIAMAASIANSWAGDWVLVGTIIALTEEGMLTENMVITYTDSYATCSEKMAYYIENDKYMAENMKSKQPTWLYRCVPDNRLCFEFPRLGGC